MAKTKKTYEYSAEYLAKGNRKKNIERWFRDQKELKTCMSRMGVKTYKIKKRAYNLDAENLAFAKTKGFDTYEKYSEALDNAKQSIDDLTTEIEETKQKLVSIDADLRDAEKNLEILI